MLSSLFGTGGSKTDKGKGQEPKDTRVASNYDGTPSKKDSTHHDQQQPRVSKSGGGGDDSSSSKSKSGGDSGSSAQSAGQSLQGAFGQGGGNVSEKGAQSQGFRDTRVASNHTETPTKRGPN
jgi:hypothetical protein